MFKDHLVSWVNEAINGGTAEIDQRYRSMSPHPSLRHFKKGISLTSQWTGTEYKNMEKVFLGIIANAVDPGVIRAARGILDFIYYAHFETHTDESLAQLDAAWRTFHEEKKIFVDLGIREHFNISKIHNIKHYLDSICSLGTADGFNTENTERLHIDFAKLGYRSTNKTSYIKQMTAWLQRQDAIRRFGLYLRWRNLGYREREGEGEDEDEGEADEEFDSPEDTQFTCGINSTTKYRVAKTPALPRVSVDRLTHDFGTTDFLFHLTSFLREHGISGPSPTAPSERSTFPVYHRASLQLPPIPEVSRIPVRDLVIATRREAGKVTMGGIKKAVPARFSIVLVQGCSTGGATRSSEATAGPHLGESDSVVNLYLLFYVIWH